MCRVTTDVGDGGDVADRAPEQFVPREQAEQGLVPGGAQGPAPSRPVDAAPSLDVQ